MSKPFCPETRVKKAKKVMHQRRMAKSKPFCPETRVKKAKKVMHQRRMAKSTFENRQPTEKPEKKSKESYAPKENGRKHLRKSAVNRNRTKGEWPKAPSKIGSSRKDMKILKKYLKNSVRFDVSFCGMPRHPIQLRNFLTLLEAWFNRNLERTNGTNGDTNILVDKGHFPKHNNGSGISFS
ncbi:hypothetical protein QE152_g35668 [Popillia japonica]|uniref:Uncharacterized protein n=1 Tax=Popillia japonica TaxID=7064 RepID=A0AAW1IF89_POPJA